MKAKEHINGATLIEVMVTIVILLVAVIGATRYQYYTALDARKADLYMEAARLAVTMLEGWKGAGSTTDFDPASDYPAGFATGFAGSLGGISRAGTGAPPPGMSNAIGEYLISSGNIEYTVTLSYEDDDPDDDIPRAVNAFVRWPEHGYGDVNKSFCLTSYEGY